MDWKTDKPHGGIILAKLVPSWRPTYQVLMYYNALGGYYDDTGEEVPESAIEAWDLIEE